MDGLGDRRDEGAADGGKGDKESGAGSKGRFISLMEVKVIYLVLVRVKWWKLNIKIIKYYSENHLIKKREFG